jgi:hypothetical protein
MQTVFWHWWVLGLALLAMEAFFPGAFFLWMGLAALVVGGILAIFPGLALLPQVAIFGVLALGSALAWRRFRPLGAGRETGHSTLNERGRLYVGRVFTLEVPIVNGVGKLRVDDGQWRVVGPDLPIASRVRVVAVDGATLKVERID